MATTTNPQDFEIYGNRLEKYLGSEGRVIVPDGVTEIGQDAFWQNKIVTDIRIPESVTKIEARAFEGCSALFSITLPKSLRYIGEKVVSKSKRLAFINFSGTEEQWKKIEKHPKWNDGASKNCQVFVLPAEDGDMYTFIGKIKEV